MLTKLEISGFRGFQSLVLDGIPQFSVVTGKNGSGKTTLLEAAMLVSGRHAPGFVSSFQSWRGMSIVGIAEGIDTRGFFQDYSAEGTATFIAEVDSETIQVEVSRSKTSAASPGSSGSASTRSSGGMGFRLISHRRRKKEFEIQAVLKVLPDGKSALVEWVGAKEGAKAIFLSPLSGRPMEGEDLVRFGDIVREGREDVLVRILKRVDARVQSVRSVPEPSGSSQIMVGLEGLSSPQPIGLVGGGVVNAFRAMTTLAWVGNGFFCWDEVENGLHYSAHESAYRGLIAEARDTGAQIMMSTHSAEALRALAKAAGESKADDFAVINLERIDRRVRGTVIREKDAIAALASGYDLR